MRQANRSSLGSFNHGAVTKEAATLETHLYHDREHHYQLQYFSPTTYPFSFSQLTSCRQVQSVCIWRCGGKRREKKPPLPAVPWEFPHQGHSGLGKSHSFSAPLNCSVIVQKSQMQSNFNCSVSLIHLSVCHSVNLLEFLHFRCF